MLSSMSIKYKHENYFSIISTFWTNFVRSNDGISYIHTANIISTIFNTAESDSAA
jgi:selenophosphate synthase